MTLKPGLERNRQVTTYEFRARQGDITRLCLNTYIHTNIHENKTASMKIKYLE